MLKEAYFPWYLFLQGRARRSSAILLCTISCRDGSLAHTTILDLSWRYRFLMISLDPLDGVAILVVGFVTDNDQHFRDSNFGALHETLWWCISCQLRLFWPFSWHKNRRGRIPGGQITSGAGRLGHSWTSVCGSRNRSQRWLDPWKMEGSGWVLV